MDKLVTFLRYSKDFLKFGEYRYIFSSIKYLLLKRTTSRTQIYRSSLGTFLVRKGTLDFQFANYAYEWGVKKFVEANYANYNVFFDIGSNIGTYAIMLAKRGLRTFAFEPVKDNYDAIRVNLILNKLEDKVKVYPVALGSSRYKTQFAFDLTNTGASHKADIENDDGYKPLKEEIVESQVLPLDDLLDEFNLKKEDKIFMKIDVEGMEANVLNGAKRFLQTFPHILIVMESVHSGKDKLVEVLNQIADFEILEVDDLNMGARKIIK
jgi:FkbM family methyltransferase